MSEVKLYILPVGRINLPDKSHLTPGCGIGEAISIPTYCYLIVHPNGIALVDTGQRQGGPCVVKDDEIITNKLKEIGYTSEDIKYVIMSHLHVDHAGYMTSFPNAIFIVRKEELRAAWWPEKCEGGYFYDLYKDTRDYKFLQPLDNEEYDVFMDGSVVLIDTKGHTRGHQSVVVDFKNGKKIVIAADAASLNENLDSMIQPGICTNNWDALASLEKLKHMKNEGYILIFGHDVEQEKKLKFSPEYYD